MQTPTPATAERLARALDHLAGYGCPVCNGDCAAANPPVSMCPIQEARAALAAYTAEGGKL